MSVTITDPETDSDVTVFAALADGYVDILVRADSEAAWQAAAAVHGLLVEQEDETLQPPTGVHIDAIGAAVLTPAVLDEEGAIVTPATVDDRYHVNLRMADGLDWQSIALAWAKQGVPDAPVNASEVGKVMVSVALIDPDTIATPVRVWF